MDNTFIQGRIDSTKKLIIVYEDAALALGEGGIQTYWIDTGQNSQKVTKLDLEWIQKTIDSLYNRCTTLETLLRGSGTVIGTPRW